jgi:hypothetical protein
MPGQIKNEPDQVTKTLNALIDECNKLEQIIQRNGLQ